MIPNRGSGRKICNASRCVALITVCCSIATVSVAQPRIDYGTWISPSQGRCNNMGNQFARINQAAINQVAGWIAGAYTRELRRSLGVPYCWLDADPAYPDVLRSAYPLVNQPTQWLILYYRPAGQFVGYGFLYSGG